ncbi:MAG TPA: hypothetical protein VM680_15720 [Verrucomicrobiae bacterium]|nr:hypothetical protein [Verrucomicrobiae bacterium]
MDITPLFAFTDGDHWRLGIGDPTVIGWVTVLAYFAAAFLCWRAATKGLHAPKVRWFWTALAALLLFLGINKQLDLQTAFTFLAKDFAKSTGWYENRRIVQGIFVVLIALGGLVTTAALFWFYRRELKRLWPALAGLGFLGSFVVIRAASFHHVDQFLNAGPAGVRMNWLLELGGIAAIAWPAWRAIKQSSNTNFVWVSGGAGRPEAAPARAKVR